MSESIVVSGIDQTQRILYSYSQQLGDKVILASLRQGANVVLKAARAGAPVRSGKLRRGIRISRSKIHRGRSSDDMLGIYIGLRKGKNGPFWGRFQEDGWKAGKKKNEIPGKHFIQDAFESRKETAVQMIIKTSQAGAEVLARKMGL